MKRLIAIALLTMMGSSSLLAQSNLSIYTRSGQPLHFPIADVMQLGFTSSDTNYLLNVFYKDSTGASLTLPFAVASIDSMTVSPSLSFSDTLSIYVFGERHWFSPVDSITVSVVQNQLRTGVTAHVVDSAKALQLVYADSGHIVTQNGSTLATTWQTGDIIAVVPSNANAKGSLSRVLSKSGDTILTQPISLTDVFENCVITARGRWSSKDTSNLVWNGKGAKPLGQKTFSVNVNFTADTDLIQLKGTLDFSPEFAFSLVIEHDSVKQILAQLTSETNQSLTATISALKGQVDFALPGSYPLPTITIWVPAPPLGEPIPVAITSDIKLEGSAELDAGTFSAALESSQTYTSGITYTAGMGWNSFSRSSFADQLEPPTFKKEGSLSVEVGPKLRVSLYGLNDAFAAWLHLTGFGELDVSFDSLFLWKLSDGVRLTAGVGSEWWPEIDYTFPVSLQYSHVLAQAGGTVRIDSISVKSGKPGDTVSLIGSGFGLTQGDGLVSITHNGGSFDEFKAIAYPGQWSDSKISFIIPQGVTSGLVHLLVFRSGFYSNANEFKIVTPPPPSYIFDTAWDVADCYFETLNGSRNYNNTNLSLGTVQGTPVNTYDPCIRFQLPSSLDSHKIIRAMLYLTEVTPPSQTKGADIIMLIAPWNENTPTNQWLSSHDPRNDASNFVNSQIGQAVGEPLDVTSAVKRWAANPSSNFGLFWDSYSGPTFGVFSFYDHHHGQGLQIPHIAIEMNP